MKWCNGILPIGQNQKWLTVVCLSLSLASADLWAAGAASHVVVVVWDGMRPDFVREDIAPTLCELARRGVTFRNHHSAYLTSTEVNGTVFATGVYPSRSGIIGNEEYRAGISAKEQIMTGSLQAVRRGDALMTNRFLAVPTLAEMLHERGMDTVVAGAKTVALLQDRWAGDTAHASMIGGLGIDLFEGKVLPASVGPKLKSALGKFPGAGLQRERDLWTARALVNVLWERAVPAYSMLWLSQPDYTQHMTAPGSATSLQAIRSSDQNLHRVLVALEEKGVRDQTDVIVISDHGFSTICGSLDVARVLRQNGFRAAHKLDRKEDGKTVLVVSNGGTVFLYVPGHDPKLIEEVVHFLQAQSFSGVVFTRTPVEGAFKLDQAMIGSPEAPDIVLSMRWSSDPSDNGTPGLIVGDESDLKARQGTHASLSRFDLHNTCIAAGPDFRTGFEDGVPTGNVDIVPTILWILGVAPKEELSGRVLLEAMVGSSGAQPAAERYHLAASYRGPQLVWRQYVDYSEVAGVVYLEEGNGIQAPLPDGAVVHSLNPGQ